MLRLADLEQSKNAVLHSLGAASSQESYGHAIDEFIGWYCSEPRLAFNRMVVLRYRFFLEQQNLAPSTINVRLAAVRRLAYEASDTGLLSPDLAAGIRRVKGAKRLGARIGNWSTRPWINPEACSAIRCQAPSEANVIGRSWRCSSDGRPESIFSSWDDATCQVGGPEIDVHQQRGVKDLLSLEFNMAASSQPDVVAARKQERLVFLMTPWFDKVVAAIAVVPFIWLTYVRFRAFGFDLPRAVFAIHLLVFIATMITRYWGVLTFGVMSRGRPIAPHWATDSLAILSVALVT
jgi:hypothetical protein